MVKNEFSLTATQNFKPSISSLLVKNHGSSVAGWLQLDGVGEWRSRFWGLRVWGLGFKVSGLRV